MFTPNHDGILYRPKRKPDSVLASQPANDVIRMRMHSNTAADLRNSLRFFTGGVGRFSDGICRVSLTVGEVSVMVSVSK